MLDGRKWKTRFKLFAITLTSRAKSGTTGPKLCPTRRVLAIISKEFVLEYTGINLFLGSLLAKDLSTKICWCYREAPGTTSEDKGQPFDPSYPAIGSWDSPFSGWCARPVWHGRFEICLPLLEVWKGAKLAQALARGASTARSFHALIPQNLEHPGIVDFKSIIIYHNIIYLGYVGLAEWVKVLGYFKFFYLIMWELDVKNSEYMIQNRESMSIFWEKCSTLLGPKSFFWF